MEEWIEEGVECGVGAAYWGSKGWGVTVTSVLIAKTVKKLVIY